MTNRTYPFKAWVLQPSFKPVEIEIVGHYSGNWHQSSTGKTYLEAHLHATKVAAINFGWQEVARIQSDLDKRTENLRKKKAALTKAQGTNTE